MKGDQTGRIFAIWAIVYFRYLHKNLLLLATMYSFVLTVNMHWASVWAIFYTKAKASAGVDLST
jgi:hypothetical protein